MFTKKALRRPADVPVGQHPPYMLLDCICKQATIQVPTDHYLDDHQKHVVECPECHTRYDQRGWIQQPQ